MKFLQNFFRFYWRSSLTFHLVISPILGLLLSGVPTIANNLLAQGLPPESGLDPGSQTNDSLEQYGPLTISETELRRLASRGGTSGRSRAGSRGDCPAVSAGDPNLTAIVPLVQGNVDGKAVETAVGTTASAYPTFLFYLPYPAVNIHSVRFVVNDDQETPLFEPITVPLNSQVPGLVSVQLPETAPPLQVGKYYRWYVLLDCSPEGGSDAYVDAFVQRVDLAPEIASELEIASSLERIDLLFNNNAWHEAMNELYILRQQLPNDNDIQEKWSRLLELGGAAP